MTEEQHKRQRSPSVESTGSGSKKTRTLLTSASSSVSGVVVKQEPVDEGVSQGGGRGSRSRAAVAEQSNPSMERPRINISMEVQLLHCAVAECYLPLKPPIFKCEAGHMLCNVCRGDGEEGHCRKCNRATAFVHCSTELDDVIAAARVPCPYEAYGCDSSVVYHETTAHRDACAYAPCVCSESGCHFSSSPRMLRDHLAASHSWVVEKIPGYGKPRSFRVPASEPHRLLAVEGDDPRLFVLSVRARGAAVAVSVACVRASAQAGPQFTCMLWAQAPYPPAPGMPARMGRRLLMETDVGSCAVPDGAALEEGMWLDVVPAMLRGPSREMDLRVRIDKIEPAAASARHADASTSA
ncbi:hypothetical protein ACP70R_031244 [Stipagrostis hirtigluma subsp. patula]